jgi:hypothetical protein
LTTYRDPTVAKAMAEQFIPLKVDAEQYPSLVDYLSIRSYPTIVLADSVGRVIGRQQGYVEATAFNDLLTRSLATLPAEKQQPVAASPAPTAPAPPASAPTAPAVPTAAASKTVPATTANRTTTPAVTPPLAPPPSSQPAPTAPVATAEPVWMQEEFRSASEAFTRTEFSRAIPLLRRIVNEAGNFPVQGRAQVLLREIEKQASASLAVVLESEQKGQVPEAIQLAQELIHRYDGTEAAAQALVKLSALNARLDSRDRDRIKLARAMLSLAREDFRAGLWLPCLLRCEEILGRYSDLPQESAEAGEMATQIKASPERLQRICDGLPEVLGLVYLTTAEVKIKQGEPQQAVFFLERILQAFPNSKHAEQAQVRLAQIQGPPGLSEDRKP